MDPAALLPEALSLIGHVGQRGRAAEQVALPDGDPMVQTGEALLLPLDALCHQLNTDAVGELDHRLGERLASGVAVEMIYQPAIELDRVRRDHEDVAKRRDSASRVVDGDRDTPGTQIAKD